MDLLKAFHSSPLPVGLETAIMHFHALRSLTEHVLKTLRTFPSKPATFSVGRTAIAQLINHLF